MQGEQQGVPEGAVRADRVYAGTVGRRGGDAGQGEGVRAEGEGAVVEDNEVDAVTEQPVVLVPGAGLQTEEDIDREEVQGVPGVR